MATASSVRDQAREIAKGWSGPDAPASWGLTAALFAELAADDDLSTLAATIPAERLPPLLFVASVSRLVAAEPTMPLAAYFPGLGHDPAPVDGGFAAAYRSFCMRHRKALAALWGEHVYQMNEVARCTQVALALAVVADRWPGRPVGLVDVGTGAGLGLYADHYRYVLDDLPAFGDVRSDVHIDCARQGPLVPRHTQLPVLADRVGIDVDPIDLDDDESRAWFRACLPPEEATLQRADSAIAVARAGDATILAGDVQDHLASAIDAVPDELVACVVDTYAAVFFDDRKRAWMADVVADTARARDVVWISLDPLVPLGTAASRGVHGPVPAALVEENRRGGVFAVLSLLTHTDGDARVRLLATAHSSGTRMRWREAATATESSPTSLYG